MLTSGKPLVVTTRTTRLCQFISANEVVVRLTVGCWRFDRPSATRKLQEPRWGRFCLRRSSRGAAWSRITWLFACNRDWSRFGDARSQLQQLTPFLVWFLRIFSNFFALRFAVVSQCPEFDSQTAMRNRINYSLAASAAPQGLSLQQQVPVPSFSRHSSPDTFSRLKRKQGWFWTIFSFECQFSTLLLCNISSKYPT